MSVIRFILVFLFVCPVVWGMTIGEEEKICAIIQIDNTLEKEERDVLCSEMQKMSAYTFLQLSKVNNSEVLPIRRKLDLFKEIINKDKNFIRKILKSSLLTFEEKKQLVPNFLSKIKISIEKEKSLERITQAIRAITSLDDNYFKRGTTHYEKRLPFDYWYSIQKYFFFCAKLTEPVINRAEVTDHYTEEGFDRSLDYVGFYTLAETIKSNIKTLHALIRKIKINEIKIRIDEEENEKKDKEENKKNIPKFEEDSFIIDDEPIKKLIKSFFADCFSGATLLQDRIEAQNRERFFSYINNIVQRKIPLFDHIKNFVFGPMIDGIYREAQLSIAKERSLDEINNKIQNFKKLVGAIFLVLSQEEKDEWKGFFALGLTSFKKIYIGNAVKLEQIYWFENAVREVTEGSFELVEPTPSLSWKTKLAMTILLSGSLLYAVYHLKQNQQLFTKYPTLQKLFPFLYQQTVQKPQSFFEKWIK